MAELPDVIWFNKPRAVGPELAYVAEALAAGRLAGSGPFTDRCSAWLEETLDCAQVHMTTSGTAALEMAILLSDVCPGTEVVMPSFNFVSAANAVVLRGGTPVFVDIRPDTLNLDETLIAEAISPRTVAIIPVHYAGVGCDMDTITQLAATHGLTVIEDAAHAVDATYRARPLGGIGQFGVLSFHETKNVTCGEGGALAINDPQYTRRAEVVYEKGTDRAEFLRERVARYSWQELGSSYALSDLSAAFLWAQLEQVAPIQEDRMRTWAQYHDAFEALEQTGLVRRPIVPKDCKHNAHLYYLLLPDLASRDACLRRLNEAGIQAVFHYVPLHSAPAGRRHGRVQGELPVTEHVSSRIIRLPLWGGMAPSQVDRVVAAVYEAVLLLCSRAASPPDRSPPGVL